MLPRSIASILVTGVITIACARDDSSATSAAQPPSPSNASSDAAPSPTGANDDALGTKASPLKLTRTVGIVLYPSFEVLDVYGPAEMFHYVGAGLKVVMIAETAGPVTSAQGSKTIADFGFADAPALDIVMVPGGVGTVPELLDSALLDFLRARATAAEVVMSVCTGSALLAKAGLLDGYNATSNKRYFNLARVAGPKVNWIEKARWVEDRNRITSSGVSAGIDASLAVIARIWGDATATKIAHDTEYTWHRDSTDDPFFEP